ncbi:hypothetical protein Vretimale_11035 [Volvox reticuliferus]|uniref:Alpha-ketoglutarate-dependent dioxygenase AlkB-like domain-containing protein n=1 Tax=Volvox reticuliferus TaxID=1737510 RepID=A0A8J4CPC0_9CHLO|nr:hypothetical protein Vretifemale_12782 [Volvox reticuliferus]GIM06795.1 hypothetical protein Vretimale_11035 [Volvox reticuliferus]
MLIASLFMKSNTTCPSPLHSTPPPTPSVHHSFPPTPPTLPWICRSRDIEEASTVRLESGDLLVFGGPGRMIFHSVSKVHPNTAPPELVRATGLRPGRLNLTFRQYRALTGGPGTRTGTGAGAGAGARGKGTS